MFYFTKIAYSAVLGFDLSLYFCFSTQRQDSARGSTGLCEPVRGLAAKLSEPHCDMQTQIDLKKSNNHMCTTFLAVGLWSSASDDRPAPWAILSDTELLDVPLVDVQVLQ